MKDYTIHIHGIIVSQSVPGKYPAAARTRLYIPGGSLTVNGDLTLRTAINQYLQEHRDTLLQGLCYTDQKNTSKVLNTKIITQGNYFIFVINYVFYFCTSGAQWQTRLLENLV